MSNRVALFALLLVVFGSVHACASPPPPATTPEQAHVDGVTAKKLFTNGAFLWDVRSPDEYRAGHIEGADNAPLDTIESRELGPKETAIILYCDNGRRAAKAATMLRAKGYTRVYELGPMSSWEKR